MEANIRELNYQNKITAVSKVTTKPLSTEKRKPFLKTKSQQLESSKSSFVAKISKIDVTLPPKRTRGSEKAENQDIQDSKNFEITVLSNSKPKFDSKQKNRFQPCIDPNSLQRKKIPLDLDGYTSPKAKVGKQMNFFESNGEKEALKCLVTKRVKSSLKNGMYDSPVKTRSRARRRPPSIRNSPLNARIKKNTDQVLKRLKNLTFAFEKRNFDAFFEKSDEEDENSAGSWLKNQFPSKNERSTADNTKWTSKNSIEHEGIKKGSFHTCILANPRLRQFGGFWDSMGLPVNRYRSPFREHALPIERHQNINLKTIIENLRKSAQRNGNRLNRRGNSVFMNKVFKGNKKGF